MTKLWDHLKTHFASQYLLQFHLLQWKTQIPEKQLKKQCCTNHKNYTLYKIACTDYLSNHTHTALCARIQIIQSARNICYQEQPYIKPMPIWTPNDELFFTSEDGTNRFFQNVDKNYHYLCTNP